ncbi:GNAT family N-acetyltransferase [Pedobacter jamesrossensis]|uniref:GNAT family N-acetyltransferase n=1 Tax=Pedobacter jamesrossensis TaxID=1908238 RepID=A0ABV8NI62_9SPHI
MKIQVQNSQISDIDTIFQFYDMAIAHQKKVFNKHWQVFDRALIETEIADNRQYKILVEGVVACVFAVTFEDKLIWGDKDADSIYIHRIVTNPEFRGYSFVKEIIKWAKAFAPSKGIKYIRMDTWADNEKLLEYYTSCGFEYVGVIKMEETEGLPKHYEGISLSLFEIKL